MICSILFYIEILYLSYSLAAITLLKHEGPWTETALWKSKSSYFCSTFNILGNQKKSEKWEFFFLFNVWWIYWWYHWKVSTSFLQKKGELVSDPSFFWLTDIRMLRWKILSLLIVTFDKKHSLWPVRPWAQEIMSSNYFAANHLTQLFKIVTYFHFDNLHSILNCYF